jgi:hypothetical protein
VDQRTGPAEKIESLSNSSGDRNENKLSDHDAGCSMTGGGGLDRSCGAFMESIDVALPGPRPSSQPSLTGIESLRARNKVPRQSLRALVQLHVVK